MSRRRTQADRRAFSRKEQGTIFVPNPKLKLLDQCREALRFWHYSYRTEQTYLHWIERYVRFCRSEGHGCWRHPRDCGEADRLPTLESFCVLKSAGCRLSGRRVARSGTLECGVKRRFGAARSGGWCGVLDRAARGEFRGSIQNPKSKIQNRMGCHAVFEHEVSLALCKEFLVPNSRVTSGLCPSVFDVELADLHSLRFRGHGHGNCGLRE
jgi:hypothetical protein